MTLKKEYIANIVTADRSTVSHDIYDLCDGVQVELELKYLRALQFTMSLERITSLIPIDIRKSVMSALKKEPSAKNIEKEITKALGTMDTEMKDAISRSVRFNYENLVKTYSGAVFTNSDRFARTLNPTRDTTLEALSLTYSIYDEVRAAVDINGLFNNIKTSIQKNSILLMINSTVNTLYFKTASTAKVDLKHLVPGFDESSEKSPYVFTHVGRVSQVEFEENELDLLNVLQVLEELSQRNRTSGKEIESTKKVLSLDKLLDATEKAGAFDFDIFPMEFSKDGEYAWHLQSLLRVLIIKNVINYKQYMTVQLPARIKEGDLLPIHKTNLEIIFSTLGVFRAAVSEFCFYLLEMVRGLGSVDSGEGKFCNHSLLESYYKQFGLFKKEGRVKLLTMLTGRIESNLKYVSDVYGTVMTPLVKPIALVGRSNTEYQYFEEEKQLRDMRWDVSIKLEKSKLLVRKNKYSISVGYYGFTEWPAEPIDLGDKSNSVITKAYIIKKTKMFEGFESKVFSDIGPFSRLLRRSENPLLFDRLEERGLIRPRLLKEVHDFETLLDMAITGDVLKLVEGWIKENPLGAEYGVLDENLLLLVKPLTRSSSGVLEIATDDLFVISNQRLFEGEQFKMVVR